LSVATEVDTQKGLGSPFPLTSVNLSDTA